MAVALIAGAVVAQTGPVTIGASLALTGALARTGQEQLHGYQMWVEDVNARGGLLGRTVQLRYYDDESNPDTGVRLYERLITADRVDLVLGPYGSPVAQAASVVTERYGFPMVNPGASSTAIWTRGFEYVFGVYGSARRYMDGAIEIARERGYRTVAVVNEDTTFARDNAQGAIETAQRLGLQVVFREEYRRDTPDFSSLLLKVRQANPDVLIGGTYLPDSIQLTRQLKELNIAPRIVAFSVGPALPDFVQALGADAEFIMGSSQWEPSATFPGAQEFVRKYAAKHGYEPGYHAAGGYAAGQILEAAVLHARGFDREAIQRALYEIDIVTIFGRYKVDERGFQTGVQLLMTQIQNGKREILFPRAASTAPEIVPFPSWRNRR